MREIDHRAEDRERVAKVQPVEVVSDRDLRQEGFDRIELGRQEFGGLEVV